MVHVKSRDFMISEISDWKPVKCVSWRKLTFGTVMYGVRGKRDTKSSFPVDLTEVRIHKINNFLYIGYAAESETENVLIGIIKTIPAHLGRKKNRLHSGMHIRPT